VMSSLALNGLPYPLEHEALIADNPSQQIEAVVRLLSSRENALTLGSGAQAFVRTTYTWRAAAAHIGALLHQAVERSHAYAPAGRE